MNLKKKVCRTTFVQDNESSPLTVYYAACISRNLLSHKQTGACNQGSGTGCGCRYPERFSYFRKACGCRIDRENHRQFYPRGFAHGFAVLSDECCSNTSVTIIMLRKAKEESHGTTPI